MKKLIISAIIFFSYLGTSYAQIGPGSACGTTSSFPCFVTGSGGGGSSIVNQGTQAASAAGSTWFFDPYIAGAEVSVTNPLAVQPGTGSTFPISASSLPLPTGAATAANQTNVESAPGTPQTTALTIQGNASGVSVPITGNLPSPDVTSTGNTINAATPNATYSIALSNARAHTKFSIVGLTASGATLTVEQSVDGGTTWVASPQSSSAGISTTMTADGIYSVDTSASTNVRLRVSSTGSGTITVASDAASSSGIVFISNSISNPVNTQIIQNGLVVSRTNAWFTRPTDFTSTGFSGTLSNSSFSSVLSSNSTRNGCTIQNTGTDIEYVYFGILASATTSNSFQLSPGQTISCTSGEIVLTDGIGMKGNSGTASYVGFSQ